MLIPSLVACSSWICLKSCFRVFTNQENQSLSQVQSESEKVSDSFNIISIGSGMPQCTFLNLEQRLELIKEREEGKSLLDLSLKYRVCIRTISRIFKIGRIYQTSQSTPHMIRYTIGKVSLWEIPITWRSFEWEIFM